MLSNMVYYDSKNQIKKTSSVFEILDEFQVRVSHYILQREHLYKLLKRLLSLKTKMRFIKDFIRKIKIMNVSKKADCRTIEEHGYPISN